jgi:hypothetical protein
MDAPKGERMFRYAAPAALVLLTAQGCVYAGPTSLDADGGPGSADAGTAPAAPNSGVGANNGGITAEVDGPVASAWENVTNNLVDLAAGGGDVNVIAQPGAGRIIAGVAKRGLYASTDNGASWFALGTDPMSEPIGNRPTQIVFDPDDSNRWWEVGIYGSGVYATTDNGKSFKRVGDVSHNDLLTIDFGDPVRNTMVAGAHEEPFHTPSIAVRFSSAASTGVSASCVPKTEAKAGCRS